MKKLSSITGRLCAAGCALMLLSARATGQAIATKANRKLRMFGVTEKYISNST
jgi:hypothetical protein